MKTITFFLFLAAIQMDRAGEIADFYRQSPRTNALSTSAFFSAPKVPSTAHGITEVGIERAPCLGSCPVYVCVIRSNGTVRYHGEAHVDKLGDWETTIDPYKFHNLANFIAESGYWQMPDTFECNITDGDTVYTTFMMKEHRKVFRNYASSGPAKLWALQQLIDGLLVGATWHPAVVTPNHKR